MRASKAWHMKPHIRQRVIAAFEFLVLASATFAALKLVNAYLGTAVSYTLGAIALLLFALSVFRRH